MQLQLFNILYFKDCEILKLLLLIHIIHRLGKTTSRNTWKSIPYLKKNLSFFRCFPHLSFFMLAALNLKFTYLISILNLRFNRYISICIVHSLTVQPP